MAEHEVIVDEVTAAYRRYVEVFNGRDAGEVAQLYDRPHAEVIGAMGLSIISDDDAQQQWFEFVMAHLDGQDWGRTEIDELWVWPQSADLAQLVAAVTRYRPDGSRLQSVRANYTFRRCDGTWKVVLSHDLLDESFDLGFTPVATT